VNVTWQEAVPVVPVGASVQLPEVPNVPVVGDEVKLTVPVGVLTPLDAVSLTVAVHDVAVPVATGEGEHATTVEDGFTAVTDGDAGAFTVRVAAIVVVEPNAFANVVSYRVPLCAVVVAGVVYDADVAPEIAVNEVAPGASEDHCTLGAEQLAGVEPAAVNVAAAGAVTV
jgi:hypothetical protein